MYVYICCFVKIVSDDSFYVYVRVMSSYRSSRNDDDDDEASVVCASTQVTTLHSKVLFLSKYSESFRSLLISRR